MQKPFSRFRVLIAVVILPAALLLSSSPASAGEDLARAQRALIQRGFDPGPVDGLMGPRTRGAIEVFQRSIDLSVTGKLDAETLEALFAPASKSAAPDAPSPPEKTETAIEPEPPAPTAVGRGQLLRYETLGWSHPVGGPDALDRFRETGGTPEMARSTDELIVPRGDSVYVIAPGERVPGFDCAPAQGRVEMELMLGVGGPAVFRSLDKTGFCKLGFGILLEVGQRLKMVEAPWGETSIPAGTVELEAEGLRYLKSN